LICRELFRVTPKAKQDATDAEGLLQCCTRLRGRRELRVDPRQVHHGRDLEHAVIRWNDLIEESRQNE
jgi:hypothetical protein